MKSGLAAVLKNSDDKRACPDGECLSRVFQITSYLWLLIDPMLILPVSMKTMNRFNAASIYHVEREQTEPTNVGTTLKIIHVKLELTSLASGLCSLKIFDSTIILTRYRSHLYCPFTATDAKLECCVGTAKVDLKARQFDEDFTAALNEADSFDTAYAPTNIPVETPPSNLNLEAYDANPIDISSNHPQEGGTVSVNGNIVGGLTSIAKGNFNLENGGGFSPSINWKSPTDFGSADRNIRGTAPVVAAVPWDTD